MGLAPAKYLFVLKLLNLRSNERDRMIAYNHLMFFFVVLTDDVCLKPISLALNNVI